MPTPQHCSRKTTRDGTQPRQEIGTTGRRRNRTERRTDNHPDNRPDIGDERSPQRNPVVDPHPNPLPRTRIDIVAHPHCPMGASEKSDDIHTATTARFITATTALGNRNIHPRIAALKPLDHTIDPHQRFRISTPSAIRTSAWAGTSPSTVIR